MNRKIIKTILLLILFLQAYSNAQKKEIVAYFSGWGAASRSYYVSNIVKSGAADKVTALMYAFAVPSLDSATGKIVLAYNRYLDYEQPYTADISVDGIADNPVQLLRGQFNQLKKMKAKHPNIKILLSIGGWGGCKYFSDAALTPESREAFVNDCIDRFILGNLPLENNAGGKKSGAGIFDGFDLDWEFPLSGGPDGTHYNVNDKENFTELLKVFRQKLDAVNPKLLLTAAVAANIPNIYNYDFKSAIKYLNWVNVMTYDYHGVWNNATAHHTNLLSSPKDTTWGGLQLSFDKSVKYFIDTLGISSTKIIPGAAFYGKCWTNVEQVNGGLFQAGKFLTNGGFGNYSRLRKLESEGFIYNWDTVSMAPWLYNPDKKIFWTFEDPKSVALKARYVDAYNLGGLMFWELSGDDSLQTLLNTIYDRNMPNLRVDNNKLGTSLPGIKLVKPAASDKISAGSNLVLITQETDMEKSVRKVEFFGDGISLGYCTKAPYIWAWFNVPKGRHKVKAIATDNKGNTAGSREIEINVEGKD